MGTKLSSDQENKDSGCSFEFKNRMIDKHPTNIECTSVDDRFNSLLSIFPHKDPEYLFERATQLSSINESTSFDNWVSQQIIADNESKIIKETTDARLQYLMTMLENTDLEALKEKATQFEFDESGDAKFKTWAQMEVENEKKGNLLEERYQTLLGLFPEKESQFLELKSLEFDFDEEGNKAMKNWIDQNKLQECICCYNTDRLEIEMLSCPKGHLFCKECIKRGSEAALSESKVELVCFHEHCKEKFTLVTIQMALDVPTFIKFAKQIQAAEVEAAGIPGLESCPFCSYSVIMERNPEEDNTFSCQHPDCGKKSCRLCHELAHVPLRCDEVEKDEEVRKRTYIENKMAEAMFRRCYQCKKPILKEGGCNWVHCSCGAEMCYYHQTPDCGHDTCNQREDDQTERIKSAAITAKIEIDSHYPDVTLKIDPTI